MMIAAHAVSGIVCIHLGFIALHDRSGNPRWTNFGSSHWLAVGCFFAFMSHAIVDALAIFTYHDSNPSGTLFSQLVFWGWLGFSGGVIYWAIKRDKRYGWGILSALAYDIWDHYILRAGDCILDGFPQGCMAVYTHRFSGLQMHHFEWLILDTVFVGVERHYSEESFVIFEILFVGLLIFAVLWLRKNFPLPLFSGGESRGRLK